MMTTAAIVSVIALLGYLILNWRSSEMHDLNLGQKIKFGGVWVLIFIAIVFIAGRLGA